MGIIDFVAELLRGATNIMNIDLGGLSLLKIRFHDFWRWSQNSSLMVKKALIYHCVESYVPDSAQTASI